MAPDSEVNLVARRKSSHGEKLQKLLPKAKLARLPGGHVGFVERPAEYNQAIVEFLSGG